MRDRQRRWMLRAGLRVGTAVVLLAGLLLCYGFWIEPNLLVVRHYTLQADNDILNDTKKIENETRNSFRLVHISDLQLGENYSIGQLQKVVQKIEREKPDVVVFSGDLFEDYQVCGAEMEQDVIALLRQVNASLGRFAVWGNRDYGGGAEKAYRRIMQEAGITLLCNESAERCLPSGEMIQLCGLDDSLFGKPDGNAFFSQNTEDYAYRILLLHEPDMAQLWSHASFQLILAGHSHGGQIRLPFCPGFQTVFARQYIRHFYTLDEKKNTQLYVNTGLGTSHLRFRLGVPPEIAVFDVIV